MRHPAGTSVDVSGTHERACARRAEADVVVLVIRVVVVHVADLQVVRAVVPAAASFHAVGAAFDSVPVIIVRMSALLFQYRK